MIVWIASGKHVPLLLPNIVQPEIREGGRGDNVTLYNEPPRCHSYLRSQTNQTTYISLAPSTSSSQPGLKWNFSWGQSKSAFVILSGGTFLMGYLAKQHCGFICVLIINIFFFNQCLDYDIFFDVGKPLRVRIYGTHFIGWSQGMFRLLIVNLESKQSADFGESAMKRYSVLAYRQAFNSSATGRTLEYNEPVSSLQGIWHW